MLPLLSWSLDLVDLDEVMVPVASGGGGGWCGALGGTVSKASGGWPPDTGLRVRRWAVLPPVASGC